MIPDLLHTIKDLFVSALMGKTQAYQQLKTMYEKAVAELAAAKAEIAQLKGEAEEVKIAAEALHEAVLVNSTPAEDLIVLTANALPGPNAPAIDQAMESTVGLAGETSMAATGEALEVIISADPGALEEAMSAAQAEVQVVGVVEAEDAEPPTAEAEIEEGAAPLTYSPT